MNPVLANGLLGIAVIALLAGLYAFWRSLAVALLSGKEIARSSFETEDDPRRRELLDERRSLLETLRDLRHDLETGKLSQADFDAIEKRTRERAKEVLRELDAQLDPYRERAEALLSQATAQESVGKS